MKSLKPFYQRKWIEAGCDEAGRGCLAGPVVAAAVILPRENQLNDLNDSKQLSQKKREELRVRIQDEATAWAIGIVDQREIDAINILNASFLAMHRAVDKLRKQPNFLLIDGNRFNAHPSIQHACFVKGDQKYQSIAAASILAKTTRDDIMQQLHLTHPAYNWSKNKGYPTPQHRKAIELYGLTPYHRKSFRLFSEQYRLEL